MGPCQYNITLPPYAPPICLMRHLLENFLSYFDVAIDPSLLDSESRNMNAMLLFLKEKNW